MVHYKLHRAFFMAVALFFFLMTPPNSYAEGDLTTVVLTSDDWCPFTCSATADEQGLLVDVTRAAFEKVGVAVDYRTIAWRRAILQATNGTADGLIGAPGAFEKDLYIAKDFIIYDRTTFLVLKDSNVKIKVPSDLNRYIIGKVAEYAYGDATTWNPTIQLHSNNIELNSDAGEYKLIDLLLKKRVQVAIVNKDLARRYLRKIDQLTGVEFINHDIKGDLYIGFTKNKRGKYFHRKFQEGYALLKKTVELRQLYQKYDVEMPVVTSQAK